MPKREEKLTLLLWPPPPLRTPKCGRGIPGFVFRAASFSAVPCYYALIPVCQAVAEPVKLLMAQSFVLFLGPLALSKESLLLFKSIAVEADQNIGYSV